MKQITSRDGTIIGVKRSGRGHPLILVHGMTADHRSWAKSSPQLEQFFTVYAMDRRGRGGSGDSPEYNLMREVEDVTSVVDAIGEPVFLFGHSLGGLFCLEAALLTDKIRRMVLYEPAIPTGVPIYAPEIPDQIQNLVERGELENAMELCMRQVAKLSEHDLETYRKSPLWEARIPLATTIPRELGIELNYKFNAEKFADLQAPTMLLLGGDSPAIYRQSNELLHSALPNSRIVVLPGHQHMAHFNDPDLFARELVRFLM